MGEARFALRANEMVSHYAVAGEGPFRGPNARSTSDAPDSATAGH